MLPRLLNPLRVLEWSTDKSRYLVDLALADVPVVPTSVSSRTRTEATAAAEAFVVKPSVSAGGRRSASFGPNEADAAQRLIRRIQQDGDAVLVQPYLGDVTETALVYRRRPLLAARWAGACP